MSIHSIKTDVAIIGGGAAGVAAAVGAARKEKSVVLIEKNSFLGGKATAAYVSTICGLYYRSEQKIGVYAVNGFAREFAETLRQKGNTTPLIFKNGLQFLPYEQFDFISLCDQYIKDSGVKLFLNSTLKNVLIENQRIKELEVLVHNQPVKLVAQSVIDCSGEAIIGQVSNLETIKSDEYQAAAQVFTMVGVQTNEEQTLVLALIRALKKGILSGDLEEAYKNISIVPGSLKNGKVVLKIGLPIHIKNTINESTELNQIARTMVTNTAQFLKEHISFFKESQIGMVAPEVGIRTGQRHLGKYILTEEDVLNTRKWKNSAARCAWPVEDWRVGKQPIMKYFPMEDYYDIPYECLISNQLENLYFAGRNISADDGAIASARMIGICLQTGYSIGQVTE